MGMVESEGGEDRMSQNKKWQSGGSKGRNAEVTGWVMEHENGEVC